MIELAGGEDVLGRPGEDSERATWEELRQGRPQIVLVIPCGYDARRAHAEAASQLEALASLGAERIVALNASAYFSRPGPRLIDGVELLAHVLHPERVRSALAGAEALAVEAFTVPR
jgi:iron complex transport system substrate-binding protein